MPLLALPLPQAADASGTGLEWLIIASFVVPTLLLFVILYAGRNAR